MDASERCRYARAVGETWTFEITRDKLPSLQVELEWALQHHNQRVRAQQTIAMRHTRVAVPIIAAAGTLLAMVGWFAGDRPRERWFMAGEFGVLTAGYLASFLPRVRAWSRRIAQRVITRRAAWILRSGRRAPFSITYTLTGNVVVADSPRRRRPERIDLARQQYVIATPNLVIAFSGLDATPRIIFGRPRGIACDEVTAPQTGYVPALPEARVR